MASPSTQDSEVDFTNIDSIEKYISTKQEEYQSYNWKDGDLWEQFQADFSAFTEENFKNCSLRCLRQLRALLRTRGVKVTKDKHVTIARSLYGTTQEEDQATWSMKEIQDHIDIEGPFLSYRINRLLEKKSAQPTAQPQHITAPKTPQTVPNQPVPYPQTPPSQNFGKELANLTKLYTEDTKYSGEDDNFDYKLMIFHDLCEKAALPQQAFAQAYSTMLRGLALDHYYTNRKNISHVISFEEMCYATRNYFEGAEHKRNILNRWNETTLQTVITKNPEKSTLECLQLLINNLRHLQHGLENNLRTDDFLHNKIITACITHKACRFACCKPAITVTGLISELRTSITAYEASRPQEPQVFTTHPQDDPQDDLNDSEIYFTDRQYHRRHQQPPRVRRYPSNISNRPYRPSKTNKCFVCDKVGCWSSNHTQEERNESRKRFDSRLKSRVDQYITDYEGTRNQGIDNAIEALVIDFDSQNLSQNEQD
jgi:hypothetical protein